MHLLTTKERLFASGFCLFGILACVCMAYEAGIFEPGHTREFLGGPTTDSLLERLRPEATLLYASIGWLAMGVGLWGTNPSMSTTAGTTKPSVWFWPAWCWVCS